MSEENPLNSKRDTLRRMQHALNTFENHLSKSLRQAYNQKFVECFMHHQLKTDFKECQASLIERMRQSNEIIASEDILLVQEFRDCVKAAQNEQDMDVCFNTLMAQKEEDLDQARSNILS